MSRWDFRVLEVRKVVDGDTVDLKLDLGFHQFAELRFRLLGIDTPEPGRSGAAEATDFVRGWLAHHMALNREVRATTHKADSFGRWLAEIYCGEDQLNSALLQAGLAVERLR